MTLTECVFAGHFVVTLLVVTALNNSAVIHIECLKRREPARSGRSTWRSPALRGVIAQRRVDRRVRLLYWNGVSKPASRRLKQDLSE